MSQIICIRLNWDHSALETVMTRKFYTLYVDPEPGYPFGRKGLALASAWHQLSNSGQSGMLLLDGDVIIDPEDLHQMLRAIHDEDTSVHTAPVRVWPVSTHKKDWSWGHWQTEPSQEVEWGSPRWFTFCFTFLPRVLIEAASKAGLPAWTYPTVDTKMSETAQRLQLHVNVVRNCWPKHANF